MASTPDTVLISPLDGLHAGYSVDKTGGSVHKAEVDAVVHQRFKLSEDVVRFQEFLINSAEYIFGVAGFHQCGYGMLLHQGERTAVGDKTLCHSLVFGVLETLPDQPAYLGRIACDAHFGEILLQFPREVAAGEG